MNGLPIMKNKIITNNDSCGLEGTSGKCKSKHQCRYKHKVSDNHEIFLTVTVTLEGNLLFHLNFQYIEMYQAVSKISLRIQNSESGSPKLIHNWRSRIFQKTEPPAIRRVSIVSFKFPKLAKSLEPFSRES